MNLSRHLERDVVLEDEHIFGAAILTPSHSCDLSTWQLTINRDGILAQTIRVSQPPYHRKQTVTLHQHISESGIRQLYDIASEVRFRHLGPCYSWDALGVATTALKARLHNEVSSVYFHGVGLMAYQGNDGAKRYLRLWEAVTEHAPFVPYLDKR